MEGRLSIIRVPPDTWHTTTICRKCDEGEWHAVVTKVHSPASLERRLTGAVHTARHARLGTGHIFQVLSLSPRDKRG